MKKERSKGRLLLPLERIREFCARNQIKKLALFGSALSDQFDAESDVDFLVEFDPGARVGFLTMASLEDELSQVIGRKVDLRTPHELSRYFRSRVEDSALLLYAS